MTVRRPRRSGAAVFACLVACLAVLLASRADAQEDPSVLFAQGTAALKEGRPGDAVVAFEALADRGVVDPVASYDRGLAYADRVRVGAEAPGDLGRAAQGFEEARDLTHDDRLAEDALHALTVVRSEVARRRTRAGQPVEIDPGRSLARTVARLLREDTWSFAAVAASALLSLGLLVRWASERRRLRIGGGVTAGIAAPVLALSVAMALAARHDRLELREAVVVSASARPADDRGIALAGATPLPEGARVEIVEARGSLEHVRFGSIEGWLPVDTLRDLAR
ncbi:MAG TPA: hypothetical protein VGG39_16335 [Polyangiaceae bacterium]|jgi:hypothetical protein